MSRTVRLRTLLNNYGPAYHTQDLAILTDAHRAGRMLTIFHGEEDSDPFYAEVGGGLCNVVQRCVFEKALPSDISLVVGVDQVIGQIPFKPMPRTK